MAHEQQDDALTLTGEAGRTDAQSRSAPRPVTSALEDVRDDVVAEAQSLGDRAGEKVVAEADAVKDEAVRALEAFSGSLRSARDQFEGQRLGFVGDMLDVAANRLTDAARSMDDLSSSEMIDAVRGYARRNPSGFLAVTAIAGFALGRVATATGKRAQATAASPTGADWPAARGGAPATPGTGYATHERTVP